MNVMVQYHGYISKILILAFLCAIFICCLPLLSYASGDHGDSGALEHKVSIEDKSGFNLWLVVLYNDHRLMFALVVTFTMAILGTVVGQITNLAMKYMGLK
jgi:hypothetical protein